MKASIDLGTNTARLLIAERGRDALSPVSLIRIITRLGGGFSREHGISPEAWERSLAALRTFSAEIAKHSVTDVRAVATSAVRDAVNGEAFCRAVRRETGIALEVIDGEEEALLTLKGVLAAVVPREGSFFVFDIGGGSTEYTLAHGEMPVFTRSLPLGVVRLTEGKVEPRAMREKIRRELAMLQEEMVAAAVTVDPAEVTLVGTAGTATTLAAVDLALTAYDRARVNNHVVLLERVRAICDRLLPLSPADRLLVPGMEKGREDLIIAGILVVLETMELFGIDALKVSDFGLLEGILLAMP